MISPSPSSSITEGTNGRCRDVLIGCALQWSVLELCVLDFLGYVLWSFTTITEGAGGRCHDRDRWRHASFRPRVGGGCGLQWSVLELCVLIIIDFLGYVLWSFTTITEGVGGRCHDIVIGGGVPHSDHEWGEGAWLGGCTLCIILK